MHLKGKGKPFLRTGDRNHWTKSLRNDIAENEGAQSTVHLLRLRLLQKVLSLKKLSGEKLRGKLFVCIVVST